MKKRLLLLVPCILLLLGFLTACTGSASVQTNETAQKLAGTTWESDDDSDVNGLISINLPFDMGNLFTLKFNSNGTGYLTTLNKNHNFTWVANGDLVRITFEGTNIFGDPRSLNFSLDGDSLILRGTGININLNRT